MCVLLLSSLTKRTSMLFAQMRVLAVVLASVPAIVAVPNSLLVSIILANNIDSTPFYLPLYLYLMCTVIAKQSVPAKIHIRFNQRWSNQSIIEYVFWIIGLKIDYCSFVHVLYTTLIIPKARGHICKFHIPLSMNT